jgi:hypothetical protein
MQWRLEDRRGRAITAGSLEQRLTCLKYTAPDGEYRCGADRDGAPTA